MKSASLPPIEWQAFDGPLDLLLEEVRQQNVAIEKIALAPLVARYLDYMRTAAERNVILEIEWMHLAATLIHWKSRSLLTRPAAESGPLRDELVEQLLAHRKELAKDLASRRAGESSHLSRPACQASQAETAPEEPAETSSLSVWDLIQQAWKLALWVENHRVDQAYWRETFEVEPDPVTVEEMIQYLEERLASATEGKLDGTAMLQEQPTASRWACLFCGMLELAREQRVGISQNEPFGGILLAECRLCRTNNGEIT